jgi:hypothetical protein
MRTIRRLIHWLRCWRNLLRDERPEPAEREQDRRVA